MTAPSFDGIDALLERGPDPEGARIWLERFRAAGGSVLGANETERGEDLRLLAALLASGGFLPAYLETDPARFSRLCADPHLRQAKPAPRFAAEVYDAVSGAADFSAMQRALRVYTRGEMLRLGARELGWGATEEVAAELSHLADACIDAALRFSDRLLRRELGEPTGEDVPASFVVIGMGKLGGDELNFSSDVDLVFFYSTDEGRAGRLSLHEYYARLSEMITRAIGENTSDGFVFRVDLRLRPEGRSGPICNALPAAERYYETFGRTWERQALLRARPCAGDRELGERLLKTLQPFVFPRTLGATAIDDVLSLRRMFRDTVSDGIDVKLSPGCIRDVELVAQVLQLLNAGRRPELRVRGTLPALRRLQVTGLISDREKSTLANAYWFLRKLEHGLQIENLAQTQKLPSGEKALSRIARQMDFADVASFSTALQRIRDDVLAIANTLGEPSTGPSPAVLRILDPVADAAQLDAALAAAGFRDIENSRRAIELARVRMPPAWLTEAIASPDPDKSVGWFRDLALGGSQGLFSLLGSQPQLLRMLANLFGTSARLSRHLVSHPALWEPLLLELGTAIPSQERWNEGLAARLIDLDEEASMREMRQFQAEELLRIGMHDVAGSLEAEEVSGQLSRLAESCLRASVKLAARSMSERHGMPDTDLTILGLGSVGAREMRYGSDLDLVFLFDRGGTTTRGVDHQEWFARLAQRLIGQMGAWMEEGRLYEIDTRLRPSGQQGLLVTTYDAFSAYHDAAAAPWERAALLRARPVFSGNLATGAASDGFSQRLRDIAYGHPIDPGLLRTELSRIRERIETERAAGHRGEQHLRLSPGGLTDCEFIAAYGQLRFGREHPALQTSSPWQALQTLTQEQLLPLPAELLDDYRWIRKVGLRIRLLRDGDDAEEWLREKDGGVLARTLDTSAETLMQRTLAAMARVRETFVRIFNQGS